MRRVSITAARPGKILWAETGGRFQAQNAGERAECEAPAHLPRWLLMRVLAYQLQPRKKWSSASGFAQRDSARRASTAISFASNVLARRPTISSCMSRVVNAMDVARFKDGRIHSLYVFLNDRGH